MLTNMPGMLTRVTRTMAIFTYNSAVQKVQQTQ